MTLRGTKLCIMMPVRQFEGKYAVQVFDIETGIYRTVLNLNPDGWIEGVSNERNWNMLYGLDVSRSKNLIASGDSQGKIHFVDSRVEQKVASCQVHRKANKVVSLSCLL